MSCQCENSNEERDSCFFRLQSCSHNLCIDCFSSKASAQRGCKPFLTCPQCNSRTTEWKVGRVKRRIIEIPLRRTLRRTGATSSTSYPQLQEIETRIEIEDVMSPHPYAIRNPTLQNEPTQYHKNLAPILHDDVAILSLTVPNISKGG